MTAVIIIVVIVIVAVLVAAAVVGRRRKLQRQFGPEYDRVVTAQNSKLRAEAELTDRQRRVRKLDIKPLSEDARRQYAASWQAIQERFVDSPQTAVTEAYDLVTQVMTDRGYPIEDDDQVLADLSVEHAQTVGHFRDARALTASATGGEAATEDLRQALIHYRALFSDLLGDRSGVPGPVPGSTATADPISTDTIPADNAAADSVPVSDVPVTDLPAGTVATDNVPAETVPTATGPADTDPDGYDAGPAVRGEADISQR